MGGGGGDESEGEEGRDEGEDACDGRGPGWAERGMNRRTVLPSESAM
jgi:hypothetical protein